MLEPATTPSPWSLTLDGTTIPLTPTIEALIAIERETGRTLYQLAEAAKDRAVTIPQLVAIVRSFAGPDCPVEAVRAPAIVLGWQAPMSAGADDAAAGVIVSNGVLGVLAGAMMPLMAALMGKVDRFGRLNVSGD